jgi:hypothetical protein
MPELLRIAIFMMNTSEEQLKKFQQILESAGMSGGSVNIVNLGPCRVCGATDSQYTANSGFTVISLCKGCHGLLFA